MLPKGWKSVPLKECAKFLSGSTPSKDRADYWGGDFPWITAKDMKTMSLKDSGLRLSQEGKAVAAVAPAGAVLVLTRGMTLLKDLPIGVAERPVSFNQDVKALVPSEGVDSWFLAYQLSNIKREILDLVDVAGHGTGRLDTDQLKQVEVVLPPFLEQQSIARLVQVWDSAIFSTEKLIANSVKGRNFVASNMLRPKSGWTKAVFENLFRVVNRKEAQIAASSYLLQGLLPIVDQSRRHIAGYTNDVSMWIEPPVIVFGDHTRIVKWVDFKFRPGADGTQLLIPASHVHSKFAYHLLANASVPNLGYSRHMSFVKRLQFSLPSDWKEQAEIAECLDMEEQAITNLEAQVQKLNLERDALVFDLLSGKRRIRVSPAPMQMEPT